MSKKTLECGICFESIDSKQFDNCIEIDCDHLFHNRCLKQWCETCIVQNFAPNCPLCRTDICRENLEIIGLGSKLSLLRTSTLYFADFVSADCLFDYIIKNKLYLDRSKLRKFIEKYPRETNNIMLILKKIILENRATV